MEVKRLVLIYLLIGLFCVFVVEFVLGGLGIPEVQGNFALVQASIEFIGIILLWPFALVLVLTLVLGGR